MGPAVDTAGNASQTSSGIGQHRQLQWGQRLIPLETRDRETERFTNQVLQWGQRLIPLETGNRYLSFSETDLASMGPAVDTAGNQSYTQGTSPCLRQLQWGQRLIPLETVLTQLFRSFKRLAASMGPAVDTAGNPVLVATDTYGIARLQWGQRLIPLETGFVCEDVVMWVAELQWGQRLIPLETAAR